MAESSPATSIIEGTVKFRDGKKWKSRWCVMRKLSPVADCVHLQLYKDLRERQRGAHTKASLSLQQYLGLEAGFTLDKESNTLALLCEDVVPVLAFDTREMLIHWRVKVQHNLGSSKEFPAVLVSAPASSGARPGPVRLHACGPRLALSAARPPHVLALWHVKLLRRYGVVEKRFCVEGGSRCGAAEGLFVFAAEGGRELSRLLDLHAHDAHSHARLSIASRSGSVLEKRFSDSGSMEECFHPSLRSASPCWAAPASHTMHCLSDCLLDPGLDGDDRLRRPTSLPRCSSCVGNITHLTRSSTMTPGSLLSPAWTMDSTLEHGRRPDSDRASMYSRSSGSASEYSVPRASCLLDLGAPAVPLKQACHCWHQKPCTCRKKSFNGPYENYDVPKTPMPLIQEHPADGPPDAASLYDTPKKLKCFLNGPCGCDGRPPPPPSPPSPPSPHPPHHNYVNLVPEPEPGADLATVDLNATLEKFESSLQILRSAGFSQEELEALEDIPEHEDDPSTATTNTVHPSTECCDFNTEISNKNGDNVSRISHLSDPGRLSDGERAAAARRSSSADFTRRLDDACSTPAMLRRATESSRIDERPLLIVEDEDFKPPEPKNETLVTKFRDAVKIRRSSSVPTKSEKNRDSSSSNDSGVSTGSLKHHRGDFDYEMPITNAKSMKKHLKSKLSRRSAAPVHGYSESTSSDPLKNLTFQFEEVAAMTKSNSCDADTLTRRKKRNAEAESSARHSQLTTKSSSSGASDTSDYMESLSVSSFSSGDVSHDRDRHLARPRSGNEYASIDRAALVCDRP